MINFFWNLQFPWQFTQNIGYMIVTLKEKLILIKVIQFGKIY